jgi:preprotein translocase SecF subunit
MKFDYIKNRSIFYIIGAALMVFSVVAGFVFDLNLGIDMTGGIQAEYGFSNTLDVKKTISPIIEKVQKEVLLEGKEAVSNVTTYKIAGENKFIVEAGFAKATNDEETKKLEALKLDFHTRLDAEFAKLTDNKIGSIRYQNVGETFGDYIKQTAYVTLALVVLCISIYIAWAFRGSIAGVSGFSFALVVALCLLHDVLIAFGFYMMTSHFFPEFKVDTFFITAMLTVLGYSVSDTIVIMDRIRLNLRLSQNKKFDFATLVNNSLTETVTRSLYTSLMVLLVLLAMFFFGPQSIKGFVLALVYGTIFGTYSSIFLAAPFLLDVQKWFGPEVKK